MTQRCVRCGYLTSPGVAAIVLHTLLSDRREWVTVEYSAVPNQPAQDEHVTLVEDMQSPVTGSEQEASGRDVDIPECLPRVGGTGTLGLGAGAYRQVKRTISPESEGEE